VRTRDMLQNPQHWAAVKALAQALLERRKLRGQEAREIIARVAIKGLP